MVCSPGSVPTQNQLFHAQRANVALSRARDRMVLVRSIEISDIPNTEDIKIPVIDFFSNFKRENDHAPKKADPNLARSCTKDVQAILERILTEKGYGVRNMGVVWSDGICVEDHVTGQRAGLGIEGAGESMDAWSRFVDQQKVIERVGWKTLRIDAGAFLVDHPKTLKKIEQFLCGAGIRNPSEEDQPDDEDEDMAMAVQDEEEEHADVVDHVNRDEQPEDNDDPNLVVISSDDETENNIRGRLREGDDIDDPGAFGDVVDLGFLQAEQVDEDSDDDFSQPIQRQPRQGRRIVNAARISGASDAASNGDDSSKSGAAGASRPSQNNDDDYEPNIEDDDEEIFRPFKKRKATQPVDRNSSEGRRYPRRNLEAREAQQLYDTDSDQGTGREEEVIDIDI
jgi:hypothetical protein